MSIQGNNLTAIADAIREKEGSTDPIVANDFPARIRAIETGVDTSDATAVASDILASKTAYVGGQKVTGTIPTKSNSDLLIAERLVGNETQAQVSAPTGFYPTGTPRNIPKGVITAPTITVSSNGLITAKETATAGYIVSDENVASSTKQLTTQSAKTWTPGTSAQTINSGTYLTGTQTIKGDSNLVASNIKQGVTIFGITGSYGGDIYVTVENKTSKSIYIYYLSFSGDSSVKSIASNSSYRYRMIKDSIFVVRCNIRNLIFSSASTTLVTLVENAVYGIYSVSAFHESSDCTITVTES